jgi:P2-related tail formation protein
VEKIHDKNIVSLSVINEKKFISADETTIKIWMITESEHQMIGTQTFNDEKITKVIYSNEKVIAATMVEKMYEPL